MPAADFNLIVRDNLNQTQDDFGHGDVRACGGGPVECGTDPACMCNVPAVDDEPVKKWFRISPDAQAGTHLLQPFSGVSVYLNENKDPLSETRELVSGDVIRVGHYTFRFQRRRQGVSVARRSDLISIVAKVLLAIVFLAELWLVYWLPGQLQKSQMLAVELIRQKVVREVDTLRAAAQLSDDAPAGSLPFLARALAAEELRRLSDYVRRNEKDLSADQWRHIRSLLPGIRALLQQADAGEIGAPIPQLNVNAAVERLLENHDVDIAQPDQTE